MRYSRRLWMIPLLMLVLAALACEDGVIYEAYPVENRGITCVTVDAEGRLLAPIAVGGFTENAGNYDLLISEDGGFTWSIEKHRERNSPTGAPYGMLYTDDVTYAPGPMPACEASMRAVDPDDQKHQVWFDQGLRMYESKAELTSRTVHQLRELRQEVRYYFFHEYASLYYDVRVLEQGPHDVDFHPESGNIVFAMGWDGVLLYTPEGRWHWVQADKYGLGPVGQFDRAGEILRSEYMLAAALGFLIMTSLTTYLVRRTKYRISMSGIGWIGWYVMLLGGTPDIVRGIMPGADHAGVFFLLGGPLLIFVALPMVLLSIIDLGTHARRSAVYVLLISLMGAAAYLIPYYLWIQGTILRYDTVKLIAFLITSGFVGIIARGVSTTSLVWAQRITPAPPQKKGRHVVEYVPLGSVLEHGSE